MIKTSIDEIELNKFNKTAQEWWDPLGEFKMLHQINPIRIDYIKSKIFSHFNIDDSSSLKHLNLLDVGCGGGLITVPMHNIGFNISALDANEHNIIAAKSYAETNGFKINFINNTVENHIDTGNKYDIIICLEVVEHVSRLPLFLRSLYNMLNEGGILIISTINRTVKSYLLAIIMAEYILGWVPRKTHDYKKFVKPSEIFNIFSMSNISLKELKGLSFDLINNNWFISDDIDVNYFATFIKN